ncbi:hypothetical protein SADUNF_Sadunf16G0032100 [Salix dunnii]|uniref:Uncharacterized protein n=1 Tax=Salix dunnii TaxID=1413687 RepID=A0A835MP73_9ROSI|nr:hypothetical protein SADUNF_Sadunf16G0032100 [Salix dunnii]
MGRSLYEKNGDSCRHSDGYSSRSSHGYVTGVWMKEKDIIRRDKERESSEHQNLKDTDFIRRKRRNMIAGKIAGKEISTVKHQGRQVMINLFLGMKIKNLLPKMFSSDKNPEHNGDVNEKQPSSSLLAQEVDNKINAGQTHANISEAAKDFDATKVAAMKVAELGTP